MKLLLSAAILPVICMFASNVSAQESFQKDTIKTSGGDLEITFIGHGTLMFFYQGKVVHVDPWSKFADYTTMPKADLILITHEHRDHLDENAIAALKKDNSQIVVTETCAKQTGEGIVMKNGDKKTLSGLTIEAVPAYNLVHMRQENMPYHPKGIGNGYILSFGDKKVYVAGDTENIPEMGSLKGIDIAFLPMNLPYTMTPEMVADAARALKPRILYPYHYGETDTSELSKLLQDEKDIEIRIRNLQ